MYPRVNFCLESHQDQVSNPKETMRVFREFMLKSYTTPLNPTARARFDGWLNKFISEYKTPDHPPYHVMIERAIRELNHKGGCSEDSILQYLEEEYIQLPFANSALLKHHLGNLRESGDIVLNYANRYMLGGAKPGSICRSVCESIPESCVHEERVSENGGNVGGEKHVEEEKQHPTKALISEDDKSAKSLQSGNQQGTLSTHKPHEDQPKKRGRGRPPKKRQG